MSNRLYVQIGLMNAKSGKITWKPHQAKIINKFKKKVEKATKTCIHLNTILKRTIAAPTFTFVSYKCSDETKDIPLKILYPKVYSIFARECIQLL